ncbi:MAG: hypothetical protein ACI4GE_11540 [Lachnospiraceae bacterium]|nr:hypothetical protein [Lachnospiraceae bacterium]MDY4769489.1 hypothetical protein [Lachnospiraceae bacterium]
MNNELFTQAKTSGVLSKELVCYLRESMEYSSLGFINDAIDILKILKMRIDRGDKIKDEVSGVIYNDKEFRNFVKKNFSGYIYGQVFTPLRKDEKVYFNLQECEGGYELVLGSKDDKVYKWISSMNEKFSLVYMIATKVVYIKNIKANTYTPFISSNGKYCRYDESVGKLIEL